jgi:hypothetical protein
MGIRLTCPEDKVALFDSVTGWAFGPVFDNVTEGEDFLRYTADAPDLRTLDPATLEQMHRDWYGEYHGGDDDA